MDLKQYLMTSLEVLLQWHSGLISAEEAEDFLLETQAQFERDEGIAE